MKAFNELREWWVSKFPNVYKGLNDEFFALLRAAKTELAERYMELPVDADGVPIRAGDKMCQIRRDGTLADPFVVVGLELVAGELWPVEKGVGYKNNVNPRYLRHYHEPNVEDVLREFADRVCNSGHQWGLDAADTISEYAAKLCLKEDK